MCNQCGCGNPFLGRYIKEQPKPYIYCGACYRVFSPSDKIGDKYYCPNCGAECKQRKV